MKIKKFENLEVRIEEEDIHSRTDDTDISTGGVGVNLRAALIDEKGISYTLFEGLVRGVGRYGDDFKHWYKGIESIESKDGEVYITLNSGLLRDTYAFNPNDGSVRVTNSVDLEKLKKQERMKEAFGGIEGKPLSEVVRRFGDVVAERYKLSGTRNPRVLGTAVDEKQGVGIVALEKYKYGYDPAINTIELYAVKPDCSFQRLEDTHLRSYDRPKSSSTFFRLRNLTLSEGKVQLEGAVMQSCWNRGESKLDEIRQEISIGKDYRKLEELLQ